MGERHTIGFKPFLDSPSIANSLPFPIALRHLVDRPEVSQPCGREYILTERPTSKPDPPSPRIAEMSLEALEPDLLPSRGRGLIVAPYPRPVFATGQSVRPGAGRGRTTFRRPVPSFPKLARQVRTEDRDGRHCVVPSSHFLNLPDK